MKLDDLNYLRDWVGKENLTYDTITQATYQGMIATLGIKDRHSDSGTALPPLWQWLYFLKHTSADEIGDDGHPMLGGFLPPVPLPLRMWAGGKFIFHHPLRIGDQACKKTTISDIKLKEGVAGPLIFVTLTSEYSTGDKLAITDELQIVYRSPTENTNSNQKAKNPSSVPKTYDADWVEIINPDPVLLFRYSALTFNSHRIHFDRPYTVNNEGYPGLVVHGPLTASMLIGLIRKNMPGTRIKDFSCRAKQPLFDTNSFTLEGKCNSNIVDLRAINHQGIVSMEARATLEEMAVSKPQVATVESQ